MHFINRRIAGDIAKLATLGHAFLRVGFVVCIVSFVVVDCARESDSVQGDAAAALYRPAPAPASEFGGGLDLDVFAMTYQIDPPAFRYFVEWLPDGSGIVFSENTTGSFQPYASIQSVDVSGTRLRELHAAGDSGMNSIYWYGVHADVSPDGTTLAFTSCQSRSEDLQQDLTDDSSDEGTRGRQGQFYELAAVKIDGSTPERLPTSERNDFFPMWSPRGDAIAFLTGARGYALEEVRLMPGDGSGESIAVIRKEDLYQRATNYTPKFAAYPPKWSPDGKRLAVLVDETDQQRVALFQERYLDSWWGKYEDSWGLYIVRPGNLNLVYPGNAYAYSGARSYRVSGTVGGVAWSPDGERLALIRVVGSDIALVTIARDGTDLQVITRLTEQELVDRYIANNLGDTWLRPWLAPVSWSPDGTHILFRCGVRLCVVGLDGERVDAWPLEHLNPRSQPQAAWSPDGSRLAVVGEFEPGPISSDPTFRTVLFTMAVDGTDVRLLVGRMGDGELEPLGARRVEAGTQGACALGVIVKYRDARPGEVRECETLLRLRETLAGNPRLNWGAGHYISAWEGVTVRWLVEMLELPDRRLAGTIPAELSDLAELTRLSLPRNTLQGSIPAELGQLTNLTHLDLRDNQLTGSIPPELGQLAKLEELHLGGNALTGCIPTALQRVPKNDLGSLGLPDCEPA